MRLFFAFLLVGIVVFAIPTDLALHSPLTPGDTLTLTRPLNNTSMLKGHQSPLCYDGAAARAYVSRLTCAPLLAWMASRPDAAVPHPWNPGSDQPEWKLYHCRIRLISGRWDAVFSLQDVVLQAVRVLTVCQPPPTWGCGGSMPVAGMTGLMYASFHVQVTGVEY